VPICISVESLGVLSVIVVTRTTFLVEIRVEDEEFMKDFSETRNAKPNPQQDREIP
jgi:hypothetical protein